MTSTKAKAQLYRLAQAHAFLRLVREGKANDISLPIEPTRADMEAVTKENPDLVAEAGGGN